MKAIYKQFEITYKFCDVVTGVWKDDNIEHNHYEIIIKNTKLNKEASFNFYGSHHDYLNNKIELTEYDLLNAFHNIVSEAHEGYFYDFREFCSSFGYDEDSREAERIYKACGKQYDKLSKIGLIDEDDYINIINDEEIQ